MQERLESSALGRLAISAFVVVLLVAVLTANLPRSALQQDLLKVIHPVLYGLGVDQNWNVFAPDPRRNVLDLEARVKYADGSSDVWHVPRGNALIGTYWDYRWGKWMEYAAQNSNPVLWAPVAEYVARRRRDRNPVFVTLVRRWYTLPPPGEVRTRPRWHSYAFYRFPVTNQLLAKWAGE